MPTSRTLLSLTLLGALPLLAGCKKPGDAAGAAPEDGKTVVAADSVHRADRQKIQVGPRVAGSLEAKKQAVIRAEVAGSVVEVKAELGEAVKSGRVLARIEDQALRDAFASAQSGVRAMEQDAELAQKNLERMKKLAEAGAVAPRDLEQAQSTAVSSSARLDEARARLAQTKKQLDAATVEAPFDGVVSQRSVNAGDIVSPGAPLFQIIDPSSMRLTASVSSDEVGALAIGKEVTFEVRGYPGQTFTGALERIAPAADPATRQITVLVSIPNPGGRLIAGLFAEGRVATQTHEGLVVPLSSVDTSGTTAKVLRVKDGKVEQVPVTLGLRDERTERVEVTSGLNPGDLVLTGAARTLAPGTEVELAQPPKPKPEPAPAAEAPAPAPATATGGGAGAGTPNQ